MEGGQQDLLELPALPFDGGWTLVFAPLGPGASSTQVHACGKLDHSEAATLPASLL